MATDVMRRDRWASIMPANVLAPCVAPVMKVCAGTTSRVKTVWKRCKLQILRNIEWHVTFMRLNYFIQNTNKLWLYHVGEMREVYKSTHVRIHRFNIEDCRALRVAYGHPMTYIFVIELSHHWFRQSLSTIRRQSAVWSRGLSIECT